MNDGEWVFLEILGHRSHYGLLTEVDRFGLKFARIEIFATGDAAPRDVRAYGGASIFSITPVSEEMCRERSTPYEYKQPQIQLIEAIEDEQEEISQCEHCSASYPYDELIQHIDCRLCKTCTDTWKVEFDACEHDWRTVGSDGQQNHDDYGDPIDICEKCHGTRPIEPPEAPILAAPDHDDNMPF